MSRQADMISAAPLTPGVCTCCYRSPAILLNKDYKYPMDMWSVGCIFAEMVLREPLFPGRSYVHQVQLILETIGTPPNIEAMGFSPRSDARAYLSRQTPKPGKPWIKVLTAASPEMIDLISRLLIFNPAKRDDAEKALGHTYFAGTAVLPCKKE